MFEFVSFKTAKVAKEHGINGNYTDIDDYKYYQLNQYKYNKTHYKTKPRKIQYGGDGYEDDIHAFTLYELQKELREKYNIIVEVCVTDRGKYYYDFFYNPPRCDYFNDNSSAKEFKTYEEALDKGLRKAIKKLI
jgi:hypothetical protein